MSFVFYKVFDNKKYYIINTLLITYVYIYVYICTSIYTIIDLQTNIVLFAVLLHVLPLDRDLFFFPLHLPIHHFREVLYLKKDYEEKFNWEN